MAFASALRRAAQNQRQATPPLSRAPQQSSMPGMSTMPVRPPMQSMPVPPRGLQPMQQPFNPQQMQQQPFNPQQMQQQPFNPQQMQQQPPFNPQMQQQQMMQMQLEQQQMAMLGQQQARQQGMQGGLGSLVPQPPLAGGTGLQQFGQQSMDMMYRPGNMPTVSPEQRQQQDAEMRMLEQVANQGIQLEQQRLTNPYAGPTRAPQIGQMGTGVAGPMQAQAPQLGQQQFGGQQSPSFGNQSQAPQLGLAGGSAPQSAAPKAAGRLF